jgi:methionine-rich copper-binding protein CopC
MTKKMTRASVLSALALSTLALTFGAAAPASAHNYLVESTPTEGETLTALPEQFIITTNDDLLNLGADAGGFALQVQDADGLFYGDGCVVVDGPSMTANAALGAPGAYLLTWQVVSIDGHTVSGEIPFAWAPDDITESSAGSDAAPVCGEGTEEPEPSPTAEDSTESATPPATAEEEVPADSSDLLWIGGAIAAVVVAGAVTMLVLSRKKK